MDADPDPGYQNDADPDPQHWLRPQTQMSRVPVFTLMGVLVTLAGEE